MFLRAQQTQARRYQSLLKVLQSPVRKLPNETLGLIFDYACDKNLLQEFPWAWGPDKLADGFTDISSSSDVFRNCPVIAISSTCSRWRKVALATPSLWSRLSLEMSSEAEFPTPFTDVLELHLERSKRSLLEISLFISGGECFEPLEVPYLESISAQGAYAEHFSIFRQAPKLRELDVMFLVRVQTSPWIESLMLRLISPPCRTPNFLNPDCRICQPLQTPKRYEQLISMHIRVIRTEHGSLLGTLFWSLEIPSLRELKIRGGEGYSMSWPKRAFNDCLSRSLFSLTKLSIEHIPMSDAELISVLHSTPSLQELSINDTYLPEIRITPITPILLSKLNRLHSNNDASRALVPRLRSLTITFGGASFQR
ncbi:hypothetical protein D9757_011448 [Collybiopsis confluens]|uniref:F-box domain-containing protein n=1 Tax=Collybiopsis confluens TaxID=2823264 RepID=A0A8H5GHT8_9AGAR|nr:hypothetical protein D9757_011448 [Collybiopsis confluens]